MKNFLKLFYQVSKNKTLDTRLNNYVRKSFVPKVIVRPIKSYVLSIIDPGGIVHAQHMYVHTYKAYSRKGASKAKHFRGCERLSKNSLYDVWQFFNGRCIGAGFSEQNVAKNGDNLRDRFNQVNGKYWNTFKCTFMLKRTLYIISKNSALISGFSVTTLNWILAYALF